MNETTNQDEYLHPELYDLENQEFGAEGELFLEIARQAGGPVLDLGCGTGRMTIPLAQHGLEVTGVDLSAGMLARARAKAGDLPIRWVEADARDFHLGQQFGAIVESGGVFMHMLTRADQQAYLARVVEHLAPGGRFVFSVFFPHPQRIQSDPVEKDWFSYQDEQGRTVRVSGTEAYDELAQIMVETAVRRIIGPGGEEAVYVAPLSLRYTYPQEMEGLLEHAGLTALERYGAPDRSPLTNDSTLLVYVCGVSG